MASATDSLEPGNRIREPPVPRGQTRALQSTSAGLARPIALASDPVATGRPRPGPRARVRVTKMVKGAPQPAVAIVRPAGPIQSSSVAPPKPMNLNSPQNGRAHARTPVTSKHRIPNAAGEKKRAPRLVW